MSTLDSQFRINRLLALGPLPPPPSGSNVSFQVFCDHLTEYTHVQTLDVIDSSPKRIKANTSILTFGNLQQAFWLLTLFWRQAPKADCTVLFGSNQFLLSLTPLLVLIARVRRKPCFVRSFGGSLDQFGATLHPFLRFVLHWGFRQSDGLLVETQLLYRHFLPLLGDKVHHVTAYRPLAAHPAHNDDPIPSRGDAESNEMQVRLRLVFVSWVRAEKGVRNLLAALQSLEREEQEQIRCDIYGPVVDAYAAEFEEQLAMTDPAWYGGELENAEVLKVMQQYDALIFPTYYQGEGYPGVIVESMAVGLPVITTAFRSIPDMVDDGVNGLLVPPKDTTAIANAIRSLLQQPHKLSKMGEENHMRQNQYDITTVLPQMIALMEREIIETTATSA